MRALLDAIPDLMFLITANGIYVDFVGDAELLANPWEEVVGAGWKTCSRRGRRGPLATIRRARDGRAADAQLRAADDPWRQASVRGEGGADRRQPGRRIVRDATELRQTERDLRAAHDRLVQRVTPSGGGSSEISTTAPAAPHHRAPGAARRIGPDGAWRRRRGRAACSGPRSSWPSPSVRSRARTRPSPVRARRPGARRGPRAARATARGRAPGGDQCPGLAPRPRARGVRVLPRRRSPGECRQVRGRFGGDRERAGRRRHDRRSGSPTTAAVARA